MHTGMVRNSEEYTAAKIIYTCRSVEFNYRAFAADRCHRWLEAALRIIIIIIEGLSLLLFGLAY